MRLRRQLEEEAEEARRRKVTVTLDLMGRKVLVAEAATSGTAFDTSASAGSATAGVAQGVGL